MDTDQTKSPRLSRRAVMAGATAVAAAAATPGLAKTPSRSAGAQALAEHDMVGLADLVRKKQVSPAELLDAAVAKAEAANPKYNFLAQKLYDYGRGRLAAGVPDGPFSGVPFLVKDLHTDIAGQRTGQGSRYFADYRATTTSELVRRYERAGLVIFGKTTTPEFGLTPTTESLATGATRNPWNPERTTGGSSGGAAAAVAAGVIPAAHATDGGGSIRIPASCCGLFGLKPSRGRMPMGPPRTEGWAGMSVPHVVSRSVRDSAALLDATHGMQVGSRYTAPTPERPFLQEVGRDPGKLRIALLLTPAGGTPVDPEVVAATRAAAKLCESLGHHVEEAAPKLDLAALGRAAYTIVPTAIAAEIAERQAQTGIAPGPDVLEKVTLLYREMGLKTTGVERENAEGILQATAVQVAEFMQNYDLILSPTLAAPPLKLGLLGLSPEDVKTYFNNVTQFSPFTGLFNQTGQPSMSVPLAMSKDGLPIGIMFSARYGQEATLLRLAGQLEAAAPWSARRPQAL